MIAIYYLAFTSGFISLAEEILWTRLFSFSKHALPQTFAFVLMFFLLGIAMGALAGKKITMSNKNLWEMCGFIFLSVGIITLTTPWIYSTIQDNPLQTPLGGILIALTSFSIATIFPIAHHLGTISKQATLGTAISFVYATNIIGSTLSPFLIGFVLLNYFTTQQCFFFCSAYACLFGIYCFKKEKYRSKELFFLTLPCFIILSLFILLPPSQLMMNIASPVGEIRKIIENAYGIITIYKTEKNNDIIFGNNVYDGQTNLDPLSNSNHVNRVIILSALHENPEQVLVIGLSIGTWLKLITSFPKVKHIDVIEINPGYLKAIKEYPLQKEALLDPRVDIIIADGRKWLKHHPQNQYDLIIMNTTYHWRAYTSSLLSKNFLNLLKNHIRPKGIIAYNTTGSLEAFKTSTTLSPHAYLYENFVIISDFDWRQKLQESAAPKKLSSLKLDEKPLFPEGSNRVIKSFLNSPIKSSNDFTNFDSLEVVTDENLITEFKYGKNLFSF
ncbi:MAG: hypothetical protein A3G71_04750 [Gammaproteobacteria bacterium RIFCSPLOWO2_12_FULL_38_14]|nr:MAG: hypothetical protein A3G71_04750 [Gammaproteobacteria bacterium RIFCSPLOWO2_12_FULL_38_14]